ncbi:MAG: hypothetical protein ACKVP7_14980 [Hyphomicrobiaceae bacterium]
MKKFALMAAAFSALAFPTLASAMTEAECTAAWNKADVNADGTLTAPEGPRYFAILRITEKRTTDAPIAQTAFLGYCKAGNFDVAKPEAGAPLPGANSFTEAQASDRAVAAGLTSISALKKDDKGVWRGTAADGTKNVSVAIDFKGNVVSN